MNEFGFYMLVICVGSAMNQHMLKCLRHHVKVQVNIFCSPVISVNYIKKVGKVKKMTPFEQKMDDEA